jgi:lipopolysaccharide/colanic/teichoic acid biosynthesis glycosyltransferase
MSLQSLPSIRSAEPDEELEEDFRLPLYRRVLDILVSLTALVVFFPIGLLIALATLIDSGMPIFYVQERVGLDRRTAQSPRFKGKDRRRRAGYGRPIHVYKFRSMRQDAESATGAVWAQRKDPRSTRVGSVLRRTHLDEVPQFVNVLRGDMTIVGPRPERPQLVEELVTALPDYALRTRVPPGITGMAQIYNGYDDSLDSASRKVEYDLYYIRNSSLQLDLQIMAATAGYLVRKRG